MSERRSSHPRRTVLTEADAARVADVFQTHQRFIENVVRQHAPTPDAVPDIVQTVGVRVCQGLNGFRGDSELRTWLYRVSVNAARDYYRQELNQLNAIDAATLNDRAMPDHRVHPDDRVAGGERLTALLDAVQRLRPLYKAAIQGAVRNATGLQMVQSEEDSSNATRKRLFRARRQLRSILDDDPRFE